MIRFFLLIMVGISSLASADNRSKVLYNSLDPQSIFQHLAFYELFPDTPEGRQALKVAWQLMSGDPSGKIPIASIPLEIGGIAAVIDRQSSDAPNFTKEQLQAIDRVGKRLSNRKLKGNTIANEAEIIKLKPEEIDLARGVFLSQLGDSEEAWQKIRSYEAMIDVMALQIAARLQANASPKEKIREINRLVFEEMRYRFPPHSQYAKDVDLYTFLPSVLDSRRGVCLGVSILYICLAQRLGLPLEMVTPPGHIYVRYRDPKQEINIETTARGIHVDSQEYLSVDTRALQQRNVKEVIGLAHMNQAAQFWQNGAYDKALATYQKARPYLENDKLLTEFMGYNLVLTGKDEDGRKLLEEIRHYVPEEEVDGNPLPSEYLEGKVDADGLKAVFMYVDQTRESVLKKKNRLEDVVLRHPYFATGYFQLATAWLQLHREGEALEALEKFHRLYAKSPTAEYYLSVLWMHRLDYQQAWIHLRLAENLTSARNHHPKTLKDLRRELTKLSPE